MKAKRGIARQRHEAKLAVSIKSMYIYRRPVAAMALGIFDERPDGGDCRRPW